jgi:hypothetical protein
VERRDAKTRARHRHRGRDPPRSTAAPRRYSSIGIDNQRLDSLLGHLLNHQYSTSRPQLRRGVVYTGSNNRCDGSSGAAAPAPAAGRRPVSAHPVAAAAAAAAAGCAASCTS